MEEFKLIESKLGELEELQNQLIEENEIMRRQISDYQVRNKELESHNEVSVINYKISK